MLQSASGREQLRVALNQTTGPHLRLVGDALEQQARFSCKVTRVVWVQENGSILGGSSLVDEGLFYEGRCVLPIECKDVEKLRVQTGDSMTEILKSNTNRSKIGRPLLQSVSYCIREGAKYAICYDGEHCLLLKR